MELKYIIECDKILIKDFLELQGFSRRFRRKVRTNDWLFVNGKSAKNYYSLKKGDELVIKIKESLNDEFPINKTPLDVLYEDRYLLIVNKPLGISSQPSRKHFNDNLISMIKNYYLENKIESNIHLVNRLDFSTSGIMIVAKSGLIHQQLSKVEITKKYLCVVQGILENKEGKIELPIKRINLYDIRRWVSDDGKPSLTYYQVLKENDYKSVVEVRLGTGRTHQIRVHFAYLNHPLIGDKLYGDGGNFLYLHCYLIEFVHPITDEKVKVLNYPKWYEEVNNA